MVHFSNVPKCKRAELERAAKRRDIGVEFRPAYSMRGRPLPDMVAVYTDQPGRLWGSYDPRKTHPAAVSFREADLTPALDMIHAICDLAGYRRKVEAERAAKRRAELERAAVRLRAELDALKAVSFLEAIGEYHDESRERVADVLARYGIDPAVVLPDAPEAAVVREFAALLKEAGQ